MVYVNLDSLETSAQVNKNSFVNINDKKVHTYSKKLDKKIAIPVQYIRSVDVVDLGCDNHLLIFVHRMQL